MNDIDDMDILYYFELLAYKSNKKVQDETCYVDQLGF
jgi:hypothetical protein